MVGAGARTSRRNPQVFSICRHFGYDLGTSSVISMAEYESPAKVGLSVFYQELGLRILPTASNNSSGN